MKGLVVIVIIIFILPIYTHANDKGKLDDIRKLLHVTGTGKLGTEALNRMISSYKQSLPKVPDRVWNSFLKEIDAGQLIELVVPIYNRYFTHDDIKELLKFYSTPVGKKTILLMPKIVRESMLAGQKWGDELSKKILDKLKKEGYK